MAACKKVLPKLDKPAMGSKPSITLAPIKRNLTRMETELVYRVIKEGVKKFREWKRLMFIVEDDKMIFSLQDVSLRSLVMNHQRMTSQIYSPEFDVPQLIGIIESFKNIIRYLYSNGLSFKAFAKQTDKMGEDHRERFCESLKELSDIVYEMLLTGKKEEMERNKFLLQNMNKARKSLVTIKKLEENLREKVKVKAHEINAQDLVVRQYQQKIDTLVNSSTEENNTKLNEAAKQILSTQKTQEHRKEKYTQEVQDMKKKLMDIKKENFGKEGEMRKRKFKMSTELRNWVRKYDSDMGWRQEEIEEIQEENRKDLEQISELESHFVSVEEQYNLIMEERRLKEEEKSRKLKEQFRRVAAVVTIQSVWRGYAVRNNLWKKPVKDKKGAKKKKK